MQSQKTACAQWQWLFLIPALYLLTQTTVTHSETPSDLIHFQRTNIIVNDVAASRNFYESVAGLSLAREGIVNSDFTRKTLNIEHQKNAKYALLDSKNQVRVLGLISIEGQSVNPEYNRITGPQIVLRVKSLDDVLERLNKTPVLADPSPLNDNNGETIGREMAVFDPDGYRVIFYELNI